MNIVSMGCADATNADLGKRAYPLMVSPKLGGVRCLVWDGVAYSQEGVPFRNEFLQQQLSKYHNLDGQLCVGDSTSDSALSATHLAVSTLAFEPAFTYHIFDTPERRCNFETSLSRLGFRFGARDDHPHIRVVPHITVADPQGLSYWQKHYTDQGYEGVILRDPDGTYVPAPTKVKDNVFMSVCPFEEGEAIVVGFQGTSEGLKYIVAESEPWGMLMLTTGTLPKSAGAWEYPTHLIGKRVRWRNFGPSKGDPSAPKYYGMLD